MGSNTHICPSLHGGSVKSPLKVIITNIIALVLPDIYIYIYIYIHISKTTPLDTYKKQCYSGDWYMCHRPNIHFNKVMICFEMQQALWSKKK